MVELGRVERTESVDAREEGGEWFEEGEEGVDRGACNGKERGIRSLGAGRPVYGVRARLHCFVLDRAVN